MTNTIRSTKNNPFLLSEQVKSILHSQGYSRIFNYSDYEQFKKNSRNAFNKAQAIANLFLQEAETQSDFSEYIF